MRTLVSALLFLGVMTSPAAAKVTIDEYFEMSRVEQIAFIRGSLDGAAMVAASHENEDYVLCLIKESDGDRPNWYLQKLNEIKQEATPEEKATWGAITFIGAFAAYNCAVNTVSP